MARDSTFGERIIWTGRPEIVKTPPFLRAAAAVFFTIAFVSVCFAVVLALAIGSSPTGTLLFGAWSATLGLVLLHTMRIWLARIEYIVTDQHVIVKRGPLRRTIERSSVSYARIHWAAPGVGDVELVRAVPTGALRRRLTLRLYGLKAPDRVAAIASGTEDVALASKDHESLAQRLQIGERVLWSSQPKPSARAYVPQRARGWGTLALSVVLLLVAVRMTANGVPTLRSVSAAGLGGEPLAMEALVTGMALSTLTVLSMSIVLFYLSVIRPGRLARNTLYLVTNRRVLIQRGKDELHLDRAKIVDVIHAPSRNGLRDVFLVLDGPRARALAASGAFNQDEAMPGLRPVLESLEDTDGLERALSAPDWPRAA